MISETTKPLLIYGTRHGTLYNLTPCNQPSCVPAIQLSYGDLHDYVDTFQALPQHISVKKFFNFSENTLLYLAPYDFSKHDCMTGCQNNSLVKIKCSKGYTAIGAPQYDKMIELLKPDYFVGLTEYPFLEKDHSDSSNKSLKRAICKTKTYLEKSKFFPKSQKQTQQENPVKINSQRIVAVHGGKNTSLVARTLEQVLDHEADGLVVCDLCESETLQEREETYNLILKRLEMEYQREGSWYKNKKVKLILGGLGKIADIEHALKFGFEAFEVNYPFLVAQKQQALLWVDGQLTEKSPIKHENLAPLDSSCTCKTCKNYSEAYIAHLIQCYELNAKILLSTHNLHIYTLWLQKFK